MINQLKCRRRRTFQKLEDIKDMISNDQRCENSTKRLLILTLLDLLSIVLLLSAT